MGREEVQATLPVVGVESRSARGRPVEPAPVHDHHDFLRGLPAGCPHLLDILAQLLRLTVRDALREALGGAILDGPNDAEHHAPGNTAPGALRPPRLPCEGRLACELARAQGAAGAARTRGGAPPAGAGQRQAPQDGCVGLEPNALPATSLRCERRAGD